MNVQKNKMSGNTNKLKGSSYEYRIRDWFIARGYGSKRIALSGAVQEIGRHDVHAWKDDLYLIIEAKKRTKTSDPKKHNQIEIKLDWTEKILWNKDEFLVFATLRSPHYCMVPTKRFFEVLGRSYDILYDKKNTFKGDKQFLFKREYIEEAPDQRFHVQWGKRKDLYTICMLEEYVTLRETANLVDEISIEDKIRRLQTIETALEFEKLYLEELDYKEKKLLYAKLDHLENDVMMNPVATAESQFWMSDAWVLNCPHCEKSIRKDDLTKKKEPTDEVDSDANSIALKMRLKD